MNIERGIGGLPPDTKRESNVIATFKTLSLDSCLNYVQKQNIGALQGQINSLTPP